MILCWFQISTVPISVYRYLYPYFLNLQCLVSNLRDNLHVQPKVKNNDVWVWVLFTFGCGVWSFFEDIFKMISTYYCRGCPWLNKFAKKRWDHLNSCFHLKVEREIPCWNTCVSKSILSEWNLFWILQLFLLLILKIWWCY